MAAARTSPLDKATKLLRLAIHPQTGSKEAQAAFTQCRKVIAEHPEIHEKIFSHAPVTPASILDVIQQAKGMASDPDALRAASALSDVFTKGKDFVEALRSVKK